MHSSKTTSAAHFRRLAVHRILLAYRCYLSSTQYRGNLGEVIPQAAALLRTAGVKKPIHYARRLADQAWKLVNTRTELSRLRAACEDKLGFAHPSR